MQKIVGSLHAFSNLFKVQENLQIFQALLLQILPFEYVQVNTADIPSMIFQLVGQCLCGNSSSKLPKEELHGLLVDTGEYGIDKGGGGKGGHANVAWVKGSRLNDLAGYVNFLAGDGLGVGKTGLGGDNGLPFFF